MTPGLLGRLLHKEKPFPIAYAGTDLVDPDTDGDGVRDGADDQDHDDVPNVMELSRNAASGRADHRRPATTRSTTRRAADPAQGAVNPFNPCLPYTRLADLRAAPVAGERRTSRSTPDVPFYLVLN